MAPPPLRRHPHSSRLLQPPSGAAAGKPVVSATRGSTNGGGGRGGARAAEWAEAPAARTNLMKESIRMGYNDLGDFHHAHGLLSDSLKNYIRTHECCTTSKHVVQMCMNVVLVSIELGQFMHVSNYVSETAQIPDTLNPVIAAKLRAAA